MPQIEVAFDIDANGILKVTAKDKGTGKEQNIVIKNATNLTDEEVERMKAEAEKHAEEDKKKKDLAEARNQASGVVFELEKQLKEHGDKLEKADKEKIEELVKKLKELSGKEEASAEELKKATEETLTASQKLGEIVYKTAQEEQKSKESGNGEKKSEKKDEKPGDKGKAEEGEVVKE